LGWVVLQACFVGWVGSISYWVGLGWITENGPTSMSDASTETFATLVKFMNWRRSGMAWDKVSSMIQCMSGTDISGRVFMPKKGILSI